MSYSLNMKIIEFKDEIEAKEYCRMKNSVQKRARKIDLYCVADGPNDLPVVMRFLEAREMGLAVSVSW